MAASLLVVLIAAKVLVLWGRPLTASPWLPLAYVWQDLAVVLGFALVARALPGRVAARVLYGALVLLAAANTAVATVLSSSLTVPLLRAARGALADSIVHHATPGVIARVLVVLALGVALPFLMPSFKGRVRVPTPATVAVAGALVLFGPVAAARVDGAGLERNPVVSLARTALPRIRAHASAADWRAPVRATRAGEDLTGLGGAGNGMNVLLVLLESTGAQYLKPYGSALDPTPNFTALAARSILFEHAYALYPESIKGLAATLAARYPAFDVAAARHEAIMSPSLASVLARHGYATALFHSGRFFYLGMWEILRGSGFALLEDAGAIGGSGGASFGTDEQAAVRRMLEWIASRRGQPFFAAYLPIAGHHPYAYQIDGPFPDSTDQERYLNALYEGDHALGTLLAGLRALGVADSTIVVIAGDHGEAFGQHAGNFGHNLALYDENVRVPFIVHVPGVAEGTRVGRTASLLDVAPTVLDLLGLEAPPAFQGASLLRPEPRMALFFTDYSLALLGVRDGCMKLVHEVETRRSRLYDVCVDPHERRNLATARPALVQAYRERLLRWSAAQRAAVLDAPSYGSVRGRADRSAASSLTSR